MVLTEQQRFQTMAFASVGGNELVALATPVFLLMLEVTAGKIEPSTALRDRIGELFESIKKCGEQRGLKTKLVETSIYALAALVDETVLIRQSQVRDEWEKYPLQLEHFGIHLAGNTFYERLAELIEVDDPETVDAVEVYFLCLLFGYKGKFNIYFEDKLREVLERVAEYLRRADRLWNGALSPHCRIDDVPPPPPLVDSHRWIVAGGAILTVVTILLFTLFRFLLVSEVNSIADHLLR